MTTRRFRLIAVVLLVTVAPAAVAGQGGASGYAGSTVAFDATSDALADFTVAGEPMAESIRVASQSEARSSLSLSVSASLATVAGFEGSTLSLTSESDAGATIRSEGGATLEAHDDGHGSLVVTADDEAQYVEVGLDAAASAESEGENRVVVTNENGAQGTVLVVGEGAVTVNEDGNVTASVPEDGRLVFRSYTDARTEADREHERFIADGTAVATVDLTGNASQSVTFDDETAVDVTQRAQSRVELAVERTSHDGKVVVATLADGAFESPEDVRVTVDGEAAVEAESYADLEGAADGGDAPAYMVHSSSQTDASADVLIALNHFSTREVAIMEDDGSGADGDDDADTTTGDDAGDATGDDGGDTTGQTGPGFAAVVTIATLVATGVGGALLARRRS